MMMEVDTTMMSSSQLAGAIRMILSGLYWCPMRRELRHCKKQTASLISWRQLGLANVDQIACVFEISIWCTVGLGSLHRQLVVSFLEDQTESKLTWGKEG